ncbi:MAG TPA: plasmid partition protein ParG [Geobacteraceae bacterium]
MVKDDTKEQISLFDLPPQEKPAKITTEVKQKPAPRKEQSKRKEPARPVGRGAPRKEEAKPAKAAPGPVPAGDVRLTANIREELHLKLKIAAATRRTTIGELIEELVETYL